jgi:hypothetical protein
MLKNISLCIMVLINLYIKKKKRNKLALFLLCFYLQDVFMMSISSLS